MRSFVWLVLGGALCAGCNGRNVENEIPDDFRIQGHKINMPNVAVLAKGELYDSDGDEEADFAGGFIKVIGTTYESPCDLIENSGPPEGEAGEWIEFVINNNNLDMELFWQFDMDYEATLENDLSASIKAYEIDADQNTLFEAAGPQIGHLKLVGQNEFGLSMEFGAQIGYSIQDGQNTPANPIESVEFVVDEVPVCPGSSGLF